MYGVRHQLMSLQGVPKVRSSNFMHYNFSSKLNFYLKFLEDVYFTIENIYSEFQLLAYPFCFFITFCSRCGMKWNTACRPTDDPYWALLSPGAQEPVQPPNNICLLQAAEKNIGHSFKKDNHPFHSKAFVLLYKIETSWALLGRLSRACF